MPKSVLCLFYVFACVLGRPFVPGPETAAPEYTVDLDAPPETRWHHVVAPRAGLIKQAIDSFLPAPAIVERVLSAVPIERVLPAERAQEVAGIANSTGIPVNLVAALQLVYDVTAFCTSIVAQDAAGRVVHARNLDYDSADQLQRLVVVVHMTAKRCNGPCYSMTTYAGFVGALTAVSKGRFSVSIDQRDSADQGDEHGHRGPLDNLAAALLAGGRSSVLVVRDLLDGNSTFDGALRTMVSTPLAAPVYFIVAGVAPGEGAVVARDRIAAKDVWTMRGGSDSWYVIETNYDRWLPAPPHDNRRGAAEAGLRQLTQQRVGLEGLHGVLSTPPVLNNGTTYTTLMAADTGEMNSTIRLDKPCCV